MLQSVGRQGVVNCLRYGPLQHLRLYLDQLTVPYMGKRTVLVRIERRPRVCKPFRYERSSSEAPRRLSRKGESRWEVGWS